MSSTLSQMPGYRLHEYLLVIHPPQALRDKIDAIKEEFRSACKGAQISKRNYLALVKFSTWEMMEEKIVQRLKVVGMAAKPFKMQLKNYGSYPSHKIFIDMITTLPVQSLVREIKSAQRLMKSPETHPHFIEDLHFTIASKLPSGQFDKAWMEYSHRQFTGSFIVDGMILLKKSAEEKKYEVVDRFAFMNLPVETRQGELF